MGLQDAEYHNAHQVRETFNIKNSEEYHYFGPVSEMVVSLVCGALEKFRETCVEDYVSDAAYNYATRDCCGMRCCK
jgi:hypothetical protein